MRGWTLVTGAAKGLGEAICHELVRKGESVVIHYCSSQKKAEELAKQLSCELIQGDFSTENSTAIFIQEYLRRFPNTKNLVNNVGNYTIASGLDTSIAEWKLLHQINFFTALELMQVLSPSIKSLGGSVVNIGVTGILSVPADVYSTAYTSTKLALWMATKSFAKEGLRANMVSPGYLENAIDLPKNLKGIKLEEAARLVSFLLDERSQSITGQNIEIAQGLRL